jgi:hypothetical protein
MLTLILGPHFERQGKRDIAAAIYEEAIRWTSVADARQELEEKVRTLRQ